MANRAVVAAQAARYYCGYLQGGDRTLMAVWITVVHRLLGVR
ncbi:hypothetical protein [uncultured Zhongshania sp.]